VSHSPYRYIGQNKAGSTVVRSDLILLDALSHCENPASVEALIEIADPRGAAKLVRSEVIRELSSMVGDGYVGYFKGEGLPKEWIITPKGRAHLVACEAQEIFDECARHTPIRATLDDQLRGSHAKLDREGVPPARVSCCHPQEPKPAAVATVCLNEDELDDWWSCLDVEAKAAAFCEYSLAEITRSYKKEGIPLAGVVGDLHPQTVEALKHVAAAAHESVTGGD
jgi:hypothetical protein